MGLARLVSAEIAARFLLLWAGVLLLTMAWALTRPRGPALSASPSRPALGTADVAVLALFLAFFAGYVALFFLHARFGDPDHDILLLPILKGRDPGLPIWPNQGRFFPLGHTEFNFLRRVSPTPAAYLAFAILELSVVVGFMFMLLRELPVRARCLAITLALVSPAVLITFSGLIFPERNLIFLVVLLLLAVQRLPERSGNVLMAVTLVATHLALYYKETAFVLVAGFAFGRLVLHLRSAGRGARWIQFLRTHPLETAMIALSGIFLALYAATIVPYRSDAYIGQYPGHVGSEATLIDDLVSDPLLLLLLVTFAVRAARVLRKQAVADPFWDPIAFAAILFAASYVVLGIESTYYLAPVDVLAALYLVTMARRAVATGKMPAFLPVGAACAIALPLAATSGMSILQSRNAVYGKSRIIEFVGRAGATSDTPVRLWFPHMRAKRLMEFAAMLDYQGIHVVADSAPAGPGPRAVLTSPDGFQAGRCMPYRDWPCEHAGAPARGALEVVAPDDAPIDNRGESLRPSEPTLYTYSPFGPSPGALRWMTRLASVFTPRGHSVSGRADLWWGYVWTAGKGHGPDE